MAIIDGPGRNAVMAALVPGSTFAGYVIEGELGRGGMSVVYRAHDPSLDRMVALKVMAPELSEDGSFRQRFEGEARAAAAVDHPNVVPIFGFGEEGGQLYIAMRYVDGADLREVLAVDGPLDEGRTVHLLGQVAAALDAAHRAGLVHRDVKPANILVAPASGSSDTEHAYLADFGLARGQRSAESAVTQVGQVLGTFAYSAPEQLRSEEVTAQTDEYALGCVVFECLTGRKPFSTDSEVSVIYAHLHDHPPAITALRPELPAALDGIIGVALAKDPADRYPSCGSLITAVRQVRSQDEPTLPPGAQPAVADGATVIRSRDHELRASPVAPTADPGPIPPDAPPPGPGEPARRGRRGLLVAGIVGAITLVIVIVVGVVLVARRPTTSPSAGGADACPPGPAATTPAAVAGPVTTVAPGVEVRRQAEKVGAGDDELLWTVAFRNTTDRPVLLDHTEVVSHNEVSIAGNMRIPTAGVTILEQGGGTEQDLTDPVLGWTTRLEPCATAVLQYAYPVANDIDRTYIAGAIQAQHDTESAWLKTHPATAAASRARAA